MATKSPSMAISMGYCEEYLKSRAYALGLTIGATGSIALVNNLLSRCMRFMSAFEGHGSKDELDRALVLRLFLAQFMNTALLQLIINTAWNTMTGQQLPIANTGLYDDFNSGWYKSVGANFHVTMLLLAITPHIGTLLALRSMSSRVRAATEQVRREKEAARLAAPPPSPGKDAAAVAVAGRPTKRPPAPQPVPRRFKTQADLNETFVGPPVDYVLRYVVVLNVVFVCFVFSAGMPLLMPIAAISLFISFNVDKAAFLFLAQRQPAAANAVARYVVSLLPMAALLHLGVGVWMLGSVRVLRNTVLDALRLSGPVAQLQAMGAAITSQSGILPTAVQRMTQPQTIPLVILFVVVLAGFVLQLVFSTLGALALAFVSLLTCGRLGNQCCRDAKKEAETMTYSAAVSEQYYGTRGGITGVKSFNCLENPVLQRTFGISQAFAETHKGLAAVAHFSADDALDDAQAQAEGAAPQQAQAEGGADQQAEGPEPEGGDGEPPPALTAQAAPAAEVAQAAGDGAFVTPNPLWRGAERGAERAPAPVTKQRAPQ